MELEVPLQTSTVINFNFIGGLLNFKVNLIIIDVNPELTLDNTLAPPFDLKNYNNKFTIILQGGKASHQLLHCN